MFFTQIRGFKLLYRFGVGWLDMSSDCIWPAYPIWEYPKMGCTPEMPLYLGNMILSMGFWGSLCSNKPVLDFLKRFPKSRKYNPVKLTSLLPMESHHFWYYLKMGHGFATLDYGYSHFLRLSRSSTMVKSVWLVARKKREKHLYNNDFTHFVKIQFTFWFTLPKICCF